MDAPELKSAWLLPPVFVGLLECRRETSSIRWDGRVRRDDDFVRAPIGVPSLPDRGA
jgi:hypothetical protein